MNPSFSNRIKNKYATVNAEDVKDYITKIIWQTIRNASQQNIGIMNFLPMIDQDQINLTVKIDHDNGLFGKNFDVDFYINPNSKSNLNSKYDPLKNQIKAYLTKHWETIPTMYNGEKIKYSNFSTELEYKCNPQDKISKA